MPIFDEKRKMPLIKNSLAELDGYVQEAFPLYIPDHKEAFELMTSPRDRKTLTDAVKIVDFGFRITRASTTVLDKDMVERKVFIHFRKPYNMPIPGYTRNGLSYDTMLDLPARLASWIDVQYKLRSELALAYSFIKWSNFYMPNEDDLRLYFPGIMSLTQYEIFSAQRARMSKVRVTGYCPPNWAKDAGQRATHAIAKCKLLSKSSESGEVYFKLDDCETNRAVTHSGDTIKLFNM